MVVAVMRIAADESELVRLPREVRHHFRKTDLQPRFARWLCLAPRHMDLSDAGQKLLLH